MFRDDFDTFRQSVIRYVIALVFLFAADSVGLTRLVKAPLERGLAEMSQLGRPLVQIVTAPLDAVRFYRHGQAQLLDLQSRLAEAVVDLARLRELEQENQALRAQIEADVFPERQLIPAAILAYRPDQILIQVGRVQGVSVGNSVVFQENLIGTISSVSEYVSQVALLSTVDKKVAVTIAGRTADGLVVGTGSGMLLEQVLQSATIQQGDVVLSSGLDGIVPELIIGRVAQIDEEEAGVYQVGQVNPAIEVNQLHSVFVVKSGGI